MQIAIPVPPGSGYFEGHFPGRPILPGVAQLDLLWAALEGPSVQGAALATIPSLRWRQAVGPGPLEATVDDAEDGLRFALRRGTALVSHGTLRAGALRALPGSLRVPADDPFPAPAALLPHQGVARLIARVAARDDDTLVAEARIPGGSAFVSDGSARALLGLEIAAQAAAAFESLSRVGGAEAGPRQGYLVGVRDAAFAAPTIPAETPLAIAIRVAGMAAPLSQYDATLALPSGEIVMTGRISTFLA